MQRNNERDQLADTIERFVNGSAGPYEWDDVVGVPCSDPDLESVRQECLAVEDRYPATEPGSYCNAEGAAYLLRLAAKLRGA